ncbi:hypothetical protein CA13_06400 [Planctomycetes bacterium CA13]|uniref:DUF6868 domain-containing protein n=1 Tax=Novipirellula herctigrandis TaxID=2527986 RepID=A0A5C5YW17_9BACT|nr:hypothetical protein CA13_06400 [Planctomycetes bacterium CA13]
MNIEMLQSFFMWCTILNGSLLVFWIGACVIAPDAVYRTQHKFFPISKDVFTIAIYCFLGLFKLMFLVFNLVPYIALLMIG